jgi:hypothetical protein
MSSFTPQDTYLGLEKSNCKDFTISYTPEPAKTQPPETPCLFSSSTKKERHIRDTKPSKLVASGWQLEKIKIKLQGNETINDK